MQRVMIFGHPGSGKTTFAQWLNKTTATPLHYLDQHFYVRDWIKRDYEAFLNIQQFLVNQDAWIIEGNNIRSLEMRYQRADTCLYFNLSRIQCLWQLLKKSHAHEREGRMTWRMIAYTWCFRKRVKRKLKYLQAAYPNVTFIEIKTIQDIHEAKKIFRLKQR